MTIDRKSFSHPTLSAAAVAVLAMALYAVSLAGTYVYDDVSVVQEDRRLHPQVAWKLLWIRSYNYGVDRLYRPLVSTSYGVQWWLHGDKPWAFHLVNILLYAACCVLVGELARRMLGSRIGLAAGLLFAAHPLHVEAVANIVGRAELACGVSIAAGLILALKPTTVPRALSIGACFIFAALCKEQGMLLPLLVLVFLLARRHSIDPRPIGTPRNLLLLAALLLWLLAGYLIAREQMFKMWWDRNDLDPVVNPLIRSTGLNRWLVPVEILGRYVALFFVPLKLSPDYSAKLVESFVHYDQPYLEIGIAALVAWFVLVTIAWKKRDASLLFLLIALVLTYVLVGNMFMLIGTSMGERLMFTPSIFLAILVVWGLSKAITKPLPYALVLTTLLALFSLRSLSYAILWNDPVVLFASAVQEHPESIRLHMGLADLYMRRDQLEEAEQSNARAKQLMNDYWDAWFQSAQIAYKQGKFDKAESDGGRSMELLPTLNVSMLLGDIRVRRAATRPATTSQP